MDDLEDPPLDEIGALSANGSSRSTAARPPWCSALPTSTTRSAPWCWASFFEEVLCWVRSLRGTQCLRALVVFDEVYGFLPPHPANPPTKRPMVALMKQAPAFGLGVVVATQNPMDLDYRAPSNAGLWFLGRLQTDADRERVIDGLQQADAGTSAQTDLDGVVQRLSPRWFVVRNAQSSSPPLLMQPRQAMSFLRGPMTRGEIRKRGSCVSRTTSQLRLRSRHILPFTPKAALA